MDRANGFRAKRAGLLAVIAAAVLAPAAARPAEFRLRNRCLVVAPVVTLGDVAEVLTADANQGGQLAAVELFPTPPAGRSRFVRQREIEDLLLLRGVNLIGHRFSGAGQVEIGRAAQAESEEAALQPRASTAVVRRARRLVEEAIAGYLREQVSRDEPWSVEVANGAGWAEAVSAAGENLQLSGGAPPWTGSQEFRLTVSSPGGPVTFDVRATVVLPPAVAVTLRSLPRGAVIRPADVALRHDLYAGQQQDVFHSIDELVGKDTNRAIPAGKVLEKAMVVAPVLIRRGQVVTVHACRAGVRVRTTARARDNGSLGTLIAVESLLDRTTYFARVCGIREAEVYARAVSAGAGRSDKRLTHTN